MTHLTEMQAGLKNPMTIEDIDNLVQIEAPKKRGIKRATNNQIKALKVWKYIIIPTCIINQKNSRNIFQNF
jgi:hypothetical protein